MRKRLPRSFYTQETLKLAKALLGKYIVRPIRESKISNGVKRIGKKKLEGKIIETEAYIGPQDKASHAYQGKITPRNKAEYLIGGHIYIYLVYGMYWQLNISTFKEGMPECVLIRALEVPGVNKSRTFRQGVKTRQKDYISLSANSIASGGISKKVRDKNLTNGPGKLCRWLRLDKSFYGEDLTKSKRIWVEDRGEKIKPAQILATGRIGIDYAGPYWSKRKWRFVLKEN